MASVVVFGLLAACESFQQPEDPYMSELLTYAEQGNLYAKWVVGRTEIMSETENVNDQYHQAWQKLSNPNKEKALQWLIMAAEEGFWPARALLAQVYEMGREDAPFGGTSIRWLQKAAAQGSRLARFELIRRSGVMTGKDERNMLGLKLGKNEVDVARWYGDYVRHATRLRFMFALARMYYSGISVPRDRVRAKEWFDSAMQLVVRRVLAGGPTLEEEVYWAFWIYGGSREGQEMLSNWLFENARRGNPKFYYDLASALYRGDGLPQDREQAYKWYLKAAELGHPEAMFVVGAAHDKGVLSPDPEAAAHWYAAAAERGHIKAQVALSYLLRFGRGIEKDETKADKLLDDAVARTKELAKAEGVLPETRIAELFGETVLAEEDSEQAVDWFKKAADKGDALAQYEMGRRYEQGLGVPKDLLTAAYWYERSAEQDFERSQLALAEMYLDGRGISQDPGLAARWLQKPAARGNPEAALKLGMMYMEGGAVPRNLAWADKWLTIAAESGDISAQTLLGRLYFTGDVLPRNLEKAAVWLDEVERRSIWEVKVILDAVEQMPSADTQTDQTKGRLYRLFQLAFDRNDTAACYMLGQFFDFGPTVDYTDEEQATFWYSKAASFGHAGAQFTLGERYYKAEDVMQDFDRAARWMKEASAQDHMQATAYMALFYLNGYGVERDRKKAVHLYTKAARGGVDWAQYHLGQIYEGDQLVKKDPAMAANWYRLAGRQQHKDAQNAFCRLFAMENSPVTDRKDVFAEIWCNGDNKGSDEKEDEPEKDKEAKK